MCGHQEDNYHVYAKQFYIVAVVVLTLLSPSLSLSLHSNFPISYPLPPPLYHYPMITGFSPSLLVDSLRLPPMASSDFLRRQRSSKVETAKARIQLSSRACRSLGRCLGWRPEVTKFQISLNFRRQISNLYNNISHRAQFHLPHKHLVLEPGMRM